MQVDNVEDEGKRRKRSKKKILYKQPFFERPEHILFRGNEMIVRRGDPMSNGPAAQGSGLVKMEIDPAPTPIEGRS